MARTDAEVEQAIALLQKIRANGLGRALDLMDPTEKSYARRVIVHALQYYISPRVAAGEEQ